MNCCHSYDSVTSRCADKVTFEMDQPVPNSDDMLTDAGDAGGEYVDQDNEINTADNYRMFDDLALGVMESNSELLASQREQEEQRLKDQPSVTFRFDISTPRDVERNGANCKVNLDQMLKAAMKKHVDVELPSKTCYIEELVVEDSSNSLPVDVHIGCKQDKKVLGTFMRSKVTGEEEHHFDQPSLWVAHSNTQLHSDSGRTVHKCSDFVKGSLFKQYLPALNKDIEDSVTLIKSGEAVEYLSPYALVTDTDVIRGDWFVDVMYKNSKSFSNLVQAIRTPVKNSDACVVSLRMHSDDWRELKNAVNENVVAPLRAEIIDLDTDPELVFTMTPGPNLEGTAAPQNSTTDTTPVRRSGAQAAWMRAGIKGSTGRATATIRATVKFV